MKRGYADTPQGQLHYTTAGDGEPLLLLHQTGSSRQYGRLIPLLASRYHVVAPDNLGSGNSDPLPPGAGIPDMARSIVDLMNALGIERAHVFGFHTGNKVGTELAAAWPDRVRRLVLCGQTHSIMADHAALNEALRAVVASSLVRYAPERDGSHLMKQWAAEFASLTATWWDTRRPTGQPLTPEILATRRDRAMDQLQLRDVAEVYRAIFAFDLGARMRQIKAPTLIVEVVVPDERHLERQGEKLLGLVPGSRLLTVEHDGGGLVVETKAEEMARVILDFLGE